MPQFSTRRRVRHSAADMFGLVADVERYPEFVPLCRSLRVIRRTGENGREIVVAEMTVAYKLIEETFTSRVTLDRDQSADSCRISRRPVQPHGKPLAIPSGRGRATACEVEFFIFIEFRSRTFGLLMGTMFDTAFRRFAAAFERRADQVFGGVSPA